MANWEFLNKHRCRETSPVVLERYISDDTDGFNGLFRFTIDSKLIRCVVSDGEHWEWVSEFEGMYEVSSFGRVRSAPKAVRLPNGGIRLHDTHLLAQDSTENGYARVTLCRDGKDSKKLVHVLVAQSFIPNAKGFPVVNHADGNKVNNSLLNLEWCSREYNAHHAIENGLSKGLRAEDIKLIRDELAAGSSDALIAERFNRSRQTIGDIKAGRHRDLNPEEPTRVSEGYRGLMWQHVSVSIEYESKPPTWDIMCKVKELFWDDEDWVVQFHPAKSQYVNHHPGCLHLWRYTGGGPYQMPTPHYLLVGPKPNKV